MLLPKLHPCAVCCHRWWVYSFLQIRYFFLFPSSLFFRCAEFLLTVTKSSSFLVVFQDEKPSIRSKELQAVGTVPALSSYHPRSPTQPSFLCSCWGCLSQYSYLGKRNMQEYSVNNFFCHAGGSLDLLLGISFMYFIYLSALAFSLAFAILIFVC